MSDEREGGMMETAFLVELRAWATLAGHDLDVEAGQTPSTATARLASVLSDRFAALEGILAARLDDERARLVAAAVEAEGRRAEADADFGTWDRAAATAHERHHLTPDDRARIVARMQSAEEECEEAHRAVETARQALADFDAATKGGE